MTAAVVDAGDDLPLTIPALLSVRASERGEHPLLICEDEVLSYAAADQRSGDLARGLLCAGAGKGTHVGLLFPNNAQFLVATLAAGRIGAVVIPLSTLSTARELEIILRDADVEILIAAAGHRGRDYVALLEEAVEGLDLSAGGAIGSRALPVLRRVVLDHPGPAAVAELVEEGLEAAPSALVSAEALVGPGDRLAIVHTSGSTSEPKGVIHQHGPLIRHQDNLNALRRYSSEEVLFSNSPFFWIGGFAYSLLGTLVAGATLVCSNTSDPAEALDLLERTRPTMGNGFAQTVAHLAAHPTFPDRDLSSMRRGNLWPIMPAEVRAADPDLRHNMLGMTETGSVCLASDDESDQPESRRGSFGRPVPGFEARVVDPETGAECAVGAVGELWLRGPFLMEGYYGRERHETFDPDGWFHTGDLFHVDEDGFFYFTGRRGDMIKTSGANVSPREVEAAIAEAVGLAAHVVGLEDAERGQVVVAALRVPEGEEGPDPDELRNALRDRLSAYKVPRRFVLLAEDEVPMLSSGKLDAEGLKDLLVGGSGPSLAPLYRDDERLTPLIGPGAPFEVEDVEVEGVPLRDFVRAPRTILDCFEMGRAHAELVNLVYVDERWTFARVHDHSLRLARELRESFGVGPGDRVAIAMRNLPEFVISFWGAALNGAIVVPLNAWWTGPELRYAIDDAGAKVVFVDPERLERICEPGHPPGVGIVSVRGPGGDVVMADLLEASPLGAHQVARLGRDDPVTILYTSGTTGRPKGALGTNRGAIANLWNMAFLNSREALISGRAPLQPRQTASLAAGPLFHIGGIAGIVGGQMGGSKMVLMHKWDVGEALRLAQEEAVTSLGGVPAMARELFEHPEIGELDLEIRGVPLGGSAVAPDLPRRALEIFGDSVQIFNGYGLTETTSAVVMNVGAEFTARPDSVGRPNLTADVKVVDPDATELEPGQVGEICVRSPQVVKGYWNDEAATSESFVDGWFHSGDLGYLDEDGYLYVVDRLKDVVIRGGENVYCAEVEAVLHEHPAVAEVAIVGIEDRALGERVCAVVVLRTGREVDLSGLRTFASERLAAFKCPEALHILQGQLPMTATSKVAKSELRALLGQPDADIERLH